MRYANRTITETDIWDVYNLTRDIEAVFRCLKTDLKVRPIHHQKDKYIEPHIWLGILAYQVVNYIRNGLKENNIIYSWTTIVAKMRSMQSPIVSLNYKHRPFVRKTKAVPQM